MSNRIQQLIMLLEDEIDRSPKQRLSSGNKRIVDCDRILDLLGDIKVVVPEEVRQAQTILAERDAILHEADSEATAVLARARVEAERMLANDKTIAEARGRAMNIMTNAEERANTMMQGVRDYAQSVMEEVQRYMEQYIDMIDGTREELRSHFRLVDPKSFVPQKQTLESIQRAHEQAAAASATQNVAAQTEDEAARYAQNMGTEEDVRFAGR